MVSIPANQGLYSNWVVEDVGVFVQQWPTIIGCDVAGEVYEVGPGVDRFQKGDRVIG